MMRPDLFAILLLPVSPSGPNGDRLGEIRVGSFTERFAVYPFAGSVDAVAARQSTTARAAT